MTLIHPTAQVDDRVAIGDATRIWAHVQIRSGARIGDNCTIGRNCFIDLNVQVGNNVKVQNNSSLYEGVVLEDGVFVGPHVIFTNDRLPRAINPNGTLKSTDDWILGTTVVRAGAALGAGVVTVTGVDIGRWAMIGSGTVVAHNVPDHALVVGNPGQVIGFVSAAGVRCDTAELARTLTNHEQSNEGTS